MKEQKVPETIVFGWSSGEPTPATIRKLQELYDQRQDVLSNLAVKEMQIKILKEYQGQLLIERGVLKFWLSISVAGFSIVSLIVLLRSFL